MAQVHVSTLAQDYTIRMSDPESIVADLMPSVKCVLLEPRHNQPSKRVPDSVIVVVILDETEQPPYYISLTVPLKAVYAVYGDSGREDLARRFRKALEWSQKSRENELNTEKVLFENVKNVSNNLRATFFSRQDGTKCGIRLHYFGIILGNFESRHVEITEQGISQIVKLLDKVPSILENLKIELKKARQADEILK